MPYLASSCPQCGGALPRQAWWRMVTCPFCGSQVTLSEDVVQAANFHSAWQRAMAGALQAGPGLSLGTVAFRVLAPLGSGEHADVYLAERMSFLPERVVLKISHDEDVSRGQRQEHTVLQTLQALAVPGAAYFSQRLPQPVMSGVAGEGWCTGRSVLVLRQPVGYWGSMMGVLSRCGAVDARHVVWMWRRVLDILNFVHEQGWCHGRVSPDHWLVQPRDHGILLTGWRAAHSGASSHDQVRDLQQSAWSIRFLLEGSSGISPGIPPDLPGCLKRLLERVCGDPAWCAIQGAAGIDRALRAAAREAFGAPRFIPFSPFGR